MTTSKSKKSERLPLQNYFAETIRDILENGPVRPSQVSVATGIPASHLSAMKSGARRITPENDLRLSRYYNISPGFFLRLQMKFELEEAQLENEKEIESIQPLDDLDNDDDHNLDSRSVELPAAQMEVLRDYCGIVDCGEIKFGEHIHDYLGKLQHKNLLLSRPFIVDKAIVARLAEARLEHQIAASGLINEGGNVSSIFTEEEKETWMHLIRSVLKRMSKSINLQKESTEDSK